MSRQSPSIQSFFPPVAEPPGTVGQSSTAYLASPNDSTNLDASPLTGLILNKWRPRVEYNESYIASLNPGPGCVALKGRIVNCYDQVTRSKMLQAAKGCLKIIMKDDTAALLVKLWYANVNYKLRLGQLVYVWTPHVSNIEPDSLISQHVNLSVSIFPERDNSCYFSVEGNWEDEALYWMPMGYEDGRQLTGLMTLKNFMEGGHEVADAKILVCVKSIGMKKKFTTKKGTLAEKVDVKIFDDTSEANFTLWGWVCSSASAWKPSRTLLLISRPSFKVDRVLMVNMTSNTFVEVDPLMRDAIWLRSFAQKLTKREHVNPEIPDDVFDIEAAIESRERVLFSLADIAEFVRESPSEVYIGYLSVIILEISITRLHQRNMLCCTECCGVPLFDNASTAKCKQCDREVSLRLSPRIVGTLIDETGSIGPGKLIWSPSAFESLFGRTVEEFLASDLQLLRYLEQRLLYKRATLMFGWCEDLGGKLAVLRVLG